MRLLGTRGSVALAVLALLVVAALAAPLLAPYPPDRIDYGALLAPPGPGHWLGTDDLGRDLLSRVLWGGRDTLAVAALASAIGLAGGLVIGTVAGYAGGRADAVLMRAVDVWLAVPDLLLALVVLAVVGPGLLTIAVALGLASVPGYARLIRGAVLAAAQAEHVLAARALGAGATRIATRHVLPACSGLILVYGTAGLGSAIFLTAGLSFLGLGAGPPSPEWGAMLDAGADLLRDGWWAAAVPGVAIGLAVGSLNVLGDALRDAR